MENKTPEEITQVDIVTTEQLAAQQASTRLDRHEPEPVPEGKLYAVLAHLQSNGLPALNLTIEAFPNAAPMSHTEALAACTKANDASTADTLEQDDADGVAHWFGVVTWDDYEKAMTEPVAP